MSAQAPELTGDEVAPPLSPDAGTPSPDAGKEVWCENGHGNRILDTNERIPFPCPTGCGGLMVEEKPQTQYGNGPTKSIELPTVGRIVHVLVAPATIRPAIVMGREADGRLFVHIFKDDRDPSPPGLATGTGIVRHGTHVGGWFWPPKAQRETFETPINDE